MTDYELTRRDAVIALAVGGVAAGSALTWDRLRRDDEQPGLSERQRETLLALADTIYPEAVDNVDAFVERYVVGKVIDRPTYGRGVATALDELESYAQTWEEQSFAALDQAGRDELLREFSVDTADPDPDGRPEERVRYYLVNELQYALYSSPTGGKLVGLENPQGHPGGTESYRQPPDR
ncbi:gluconate 2-dehydrogenase subunit 3 family protein [Halomicrobium mukohataei]|uniref:Gluconate 2-dehydrogenase subunit 3 family protein n=1 Tax=Halomicrobium mukohataei TaxID=57705 RepID=A0A847UDL3_9EURY|nr:gluconate 2-dehydrogenase subunit 3 family protein [Halomicrobium mukohataei]NLV10576.1 gluconate 2-dehydrogenase subunit 3 family protein [Halomicrobium mukohataei]